MRDMEMIFMKWNFFFLCEILEGWLISQNADDDVSIKFHFLKNNRENIQQELSHLNSNLRTECVCKGIGGE